MFKRGWGWGLPCVFACKDVQIDERFYVHLDRFLTQRLESLFRTSVARGYDLLAQEGNYLMDVHQIPILELTGFAPLL